MLAPATPTISGFTAREVPQVPTRVTETTNSVGGKGAQPPSNPHEWGDTPPLKFPRNHYLGQRVAEKPSTF